MNNIGLAIDFKQLKTFTTEILKSLDHRYLNELGQFSQSNPSSENISRFIFEELKKKLQGTGAWPYKVTAWESEKACASYLED